MKFGKYTGDEFNALWKKPLYISIFPQHQLSIGTYEHDWTKKMMRSSVTDITSSFTISDGIDIFQLICDGNDKCVAFGKLCVPDDAIVFVMDEAKNVFITNKINIEQIIPIQTFIDQHSDEFLNTIKKNGFIIQYHNNPTDIMKLEAIRQTSSNLRYIKNQSQSDQLEACNISDNCFKFINYNNSDIPLFEKYKSTMGTGDKKLDIINVIKLYQYYTHDLQMQFV